MDANQAWRAMIMCVAAGLGIAVTAGVLALANYPDVLEGMLHVMGVQGRGTNCEKERRRRPRQQRATCVKASEEEVHFRREISSVDNALIRRENWLISAKHASRKGIELVPVTVVAGPLGSGKTTLTARAVSCPKNFRLGVVVNDFAQLNVDHKQLQEVAEMEKASVEASERVPQVVELSDGCVCCSLRSGLVEAVRALVGSFSGANAKVDYILVETSGLSDPVEMARVIEQEIDCGVRLDSVVMVVDADNWKQFVSRSHSHAQQLRHADVVILNKVDLLGDEISAKEVVDKLQACTDAPVIPASFCNVLLESVMDIVRVDPEREAFGRIPQGGRERARLGAYSIPTNGGNLLRRAKLSRTSNPAHLLDKSSDDSWHTLSFCGLRALSLRSLQRFVISDESLFQSIRRVKGDVFFYGMPDRRLSLQVSGQRRIDVTDLGPWCSAPKIALALVINGNTALAAKLEAALERSTELEEDMQGVDIFLNSALVSNGNWQIFDVDTKLGCFKIRLTGARSYGMTPDQLKLRFGVNIDAVQHNFCKSINSSGRGVLALQGGFGHEEQAFVLLALPGNESELEYLSQSLEYAAQTTFRTDLSHVRMCGCD